MIIGANKNIIGNLTDGETGQSIYSKLTIMNRHMHSIGLLYPLLADPVLLTKDAGIWAAFPATKTQIIPANTITDYFDIHHINVTSLSALGSYVIALYQGLAGFEELLCYGVATRTAIGGTEGMCPVITSGNGGSLIAPNTRISAALSSGNNTADTLNVKLHYHIY